MQSWGVPRLYRRAILVYVVAIAAPVAALVWLGIQSLERQRTIIVAQAREAVARELTTRLQTAARNAFGDLTHPIVGDRFEMQAGMLIRPALRAPVPESVPEPFVDAYGKENGHQFVQALAAYRALEKTSDRPSLALHGIARCLDRMGAHDQAREVWRRLAEQFPDDRDLSHRPYGIVAAIAVGESARLYDAIVSGRWELSRDQAQYFLEELAPGRSTPYLKRFDLAEELQVAFHPSLPSGDSDVHQGVAGAYRLFYRRDGADRIVGFSVNEAWVNDTLRPEIERLLDVTGSTDRDIWIYVASVGLVLMVLSAGVVLLLRDVSREARINRAREELVSSVSHELKTPITLVRLYSETLLRHRGFAEEERLGFYRIIARESTRLGRLIDQVLAFSRVDRGAQVYHFEEGDVTTLVAGVLDDYREYLEHAGFRLRQTVPESAPLTCFDAAAMSQALLNLLDNAVKYSGDARHIGVRVGVDAGHIAIEVEDHGVGIAPADQTRIFDRFYRSPDGNGKGGYGLGLFLVRHIMEAHGGRTEVESEPGRGSRFRLILPVATA
jgi:signal transduction histidine kinase